MAFIKIDKTGLQAVELGDSDSIQIGQKVVAIGNALGEFNNTVTSGIVSGVGRPISTQTATGYETLSNLIQTDAAINPGNSGGPLVNLDGQVIGINVAKADAQGIGFAIPVNEAKVVIDSVIKNGKIVRPYLGIRYLANNKDYRTQYDFPTADGVIIVGSLGQKGVLSDSPAEKAGLQEQDILIKIAGKDINQKQSLASILSTLKVGDKVEIEFYRGNELKKAELTLSEQTQ